MHGDLSSSHDHTNSMHGNVVKFGMWYASGQSRQTHKSVDIADRNTSRTFDREQSRNSLFDWGQCSRKRVRQLKKRKKSYFWILKKRKVRRPILEHWLRVNTLAKSDRSLLLAGLYVDGIHSSCRLIVIFGLIGLQYKLSRYSWNWIQLMCTISTKKQKIPIRLLQTLRSVCNSLRPCTDSAGPYSV